jgi:hypothetical protein
MIYKDAEFKWDDKWKDAFNYIKVAISRVSVLRSPDFNRDFSLYTFAFDQSLVVVLDPDLCRNTMKYRNTHKCRDAAEIRLHFINNK